MRYIAYCEKGNCPYCGSENIEYETSKLAGDTYDYNCVCNDCGGDFIECYTLEFEGHYVHNDLMED